MKYLILFLITSTSYQVLAQQTTAKLEVSADTTTYSDADKLIESVPMYKGVFKYGGRYPGTTTPDSIPTVGESVKAQIQKCRDCPSDKSFHMFRVTIDQYGAVSQVIPLVPYAPNEGTECWEVAKKAFFATSGDWSPAIRNGKKVKFKFNVMVR